MWNLKDINEKKNYVTEGLKDCSNSKEKETLALTRLSYIAMLDNSGSLSYMGLYNTMNRLT